MTKTYHSLVVALALASTCARADLIWSWNYSDPNVFVGPDDTIEVYIEILNDPLSTGGLHVGLPIVSIEPAWEQYYSFSLGTLDVDLAPGMSTTVYYCTFSPKMTVPVGTAFTFNSSIAPSSGIEPVGPWLGPDEDLQIAVIPEPTTVCLLLCGVIPLLMKQIRRTRPSWLSAARGPPQPEG